jgi:signal transduction histidine kinase
MLKEHLAGNNLLQVINDILDFSKVEAGRLDLKRHPFSSLLHCSELNCLMPPKE